MSQTENMKIFGDDQQERSTFNAAMRGLRCKCPSCGTGKLFSSFLKVNDTCAHCKTELHHHRADDFPAYIVIFIVGHLAVGLYMLIDRSFTLLWWEHLAIWIPFVTIMSIVLLPFVKGSVVGMQWALLMHGFSGEDDAAH